MTGPRSCGNAAPKAALYCLPTPCPAPFGLSLYGLAIRAIIWWNGLSDCCVFGVFVGEVSLNSPGGGDVGVAARPDRLSSAWRGRAHTRPRQPGIYLQRRVVIGDGLVEAAEPQ